MGSGGHGSTAGLDQLLQLVASLSSWKVTKENLGGVGAIVIGCPILFALCSVVSFLSLILCIWGFIRMLKAFSAFP